MEKYITPQAMVRPAEDIESRAIASKSAMAATLKLAVINGEFYRDKRDERDRQDILSRLFSDDRRVAERYRHRYGSTLSALAMQTHRYYWID